MPEDLQELRRINLTEAFPFTQLFRSFRLAIHPHKLLLALVALALTYAAGRAMDGIWPATTVMPAAGSADATTEVDAYSDAPSCEAFCEWVRAAKEARPEREAVLLSRIKPDVKPEDARKIAKNDQARGDILQAARDARDEAEQALKTVSGNIAKTAEDRQGSLYKAYESVMVAALIGPTRKVDSDQAMASLALLTKDEKICGKKDRDAIEKAIRAQVVVRDLALLRGKGIFATLLRHEIRAFTSAVRSILSLEIGLGSQPPVGLKAAFFDAVGGILWLFGAHWFYAVVFCLLSLIIWSMFGGAICRIAALHAARDEKITFKQSLKFSGRKLFSFFSAPLIPLALVIVIGAFVFAGGLLSAIPYVGEIFAGVLWPLALLGGFIMVLVIVGAVAGFLLMFPTIAVEGSDSFDALSRSFSYVYSKPWRTAFYVLVSGLYGAICYLFVQLFAHLLLNATHIASGLGMNVDGSSRLPETVGKLEAMWMRTGLLEPGRFYGSFGQYPLNATETFGGFLIMVWTFLVLGMVISFVISFFFSASTLIYYLLRREVDATDIEDVYLEEYEEEVIPETTPPTEPAVEEKPEEEQKPPEPPPAAEPEAEDTSSQPDKSEEGPAPGGAESGETGESGEPDKPGKAS